MLGVLPFVEDPDLSWTAGPAVPQHLPLCCLPKLMFFTHCVKRPPPPLCFTQSCCGFFDITVEKCVSVCCDKLPHNSAKISGKNVKSTLKFYPSRFFFCVNLRLAEGTQCGTVKKNAISVTLHSCLQAL